MAQLLIQDLDRCALVYPGCMYGVAVSGEVTGQIGQELAGGRRVGVEELVEGGCAWAGRSIGQVGTAHG
jgi:hypothetical protein